MATYTCTIRTNYFRVTDEDQYQKLAKSLWGEERIQLFTKKLDDGTILHGFGSYCNIEYLPADANTDEDDDELCDIEEFYKELQKILPDNEVFVLEEVGNEKLRYVGAYATIVTNKEIRHIGFNRQIETLAKELSHNPDYVLNIEY